MERQVREVFTASQITRKYLLWISLQWINHLDWRQDYRPEGKEYIHVFLWVRMRCFPLLYKSEGILQIDLRQCRILIKVGFQIEGVC